MVVRWMVAVPIICTFSFLWQEKRLVSRRAVSIVIVPDILPLRSLSSKRKTEKSVYRVYLCTILYLT